MTRKLMTPLVVGGLTAAMIAYPAVQIWGTPGLAVGAAMGVLDVLLALRPAPARMLGGDRRCG